MLIIISYHSLLSNQYITHPPLSPLKHILSPLLLLVNDGRLQPFLVLPPSFPQPPQSKFFVTHTDDYEFLNVVSWGSYGVVYRARHKETKEIVAVKKEVGGLCASTVTEIDILKFLQPHPSIIAFKEVAIDDKGSVFLVMEHSDSDLKRLMEARNGKPLSLSQIKYITKEILNGVAFLHDSGVMHRDIKPANILVNRKNEVKICDFGLSTHFPTLGHQYRPRVGTLAYKAPELLLGSCTYSSAVDLWAVGCVMAELVLGRVMFRGRSEAETLYSVRYVLRTPYNQLRLKMDTEAAFSGATWLTRSGFDLLERLLEYDPVKRITAREAVDHRWFMEAN